MSSPLKIIEPLSILPGGIGISLITVREAVVFPQPGAKGFRVVAKRL